MFDEICYTHAVYLIQPDGSSYRYSQCMSLEEAERDARWIRKKGYRAQVVEEYEEAYTYGGDSSQWW